MAGFSTHVTIPPTTELHRLEIQLRVEQIREVVGKNERYFNSKQEVVDYLNDIGVRSTYGKKVTPQLLDKFRRHMQFPYATFSIRHANIVTSNVMIMAWLWSLKVYKASKFWKGASRHDAIAHLLG